MTRPLTRAEVSLLTVAAQQPCSSIRMLQNALGLNSYNHVFHRVKRLLARGLLIDQSRETDRRSKIVASPAGLAELEKRK